METAKLTTKRVDAFLGRLSELVVALPSAERKAEIDHELDALIDFLLDVKKRLSHVPTSDDAAGLEASFNTLRHFIQIAEADPLISKALGLQERKTRQRPNRPHKHADLDITQEIAELRLLSPDEMRQTFEDKHKYTVATLRRIGAEFGIRVRSNATRALISEQIVKRAGNLAGYEYLRDHA